MFETSNHAAQSVFIIETFWQRVNRIRERREQLRQTIEANFRARGLYA